MIDQLKSESTNFTVHTDFFEMCLTLVQRLLTKILRYSDIQDGQTNVSLTADF